jgi:predicted esterase
MTRQDRELAIADNVAYVAAVIEAVEREFSIRETAVFAGFSQGVAMAFRAACSTAYGRRVAAVALGGDVPPELDGARLARVGAALVGRGLRDQWYGERQWAADVERLRGAGVEARGVAVDAGHEWTAEFSAAAGTFLQDLGR